MQSLGLLHRGRNLQQRRRNDRRMWRHRPLIPLHTLPLLEQASTPTLPSSRASLMPFHFLSLRRPFRVHFEIFGRRYCVRALEPCSTGPKSVWLGQDGKLRILLTLRHIYNHGGNVGNECGDQPRGRSRSSALGIQKAALSLNLT